MIGRPVVRRLLPLRPVLVAMALTGEGAAPAPGMPAHWDARPAGGGTDVGDCCEQGVLPEVVRVPPGNLGDQIRLGSAAERGRGQHSELKLVVPPSAECALRRRRYRASVCRARSAGRQPRPGAWGASWQAFSGRRPQPPLPVRLSRCRPGPGLSWPVGVTAGARPRAHATRSPRTTATAQLTPRCRVKVTVSRSGPLTGQRPGGRPSRPRPAQWRTPARHVHRPGPPAAGPAHRRVRSRQCDRRTLCPVS
jgi:hypothetical protein